MNISWLYCYMERWYDIMFPSSLSFHGVVATTTTTTTTIHVIIVEMTNTDNMKYKVKTLGLDEFGYPRFFWKQRVIALDWRKRADMKYWWWTVGELEMEMVKDWETWRCGWIEWGYTIRYSLIYCSFYWNDMSTLLVSQITHFSCF